MKIKLCIFDLDGTLLDTIDDIANSMNRVLMANQYPTYDVKWYKQNVGNGAKRLLLDALPAEHGLPPEKISELLTAYKKDYNSSSTVLTKPYDGIPELLEHLAALSVQVAVVTNKPQNIAETLLNEYFSDVNFIAVRGEYPGGPIKPDPVLAEEVLSIAEVSPDQAILIGDTEVDMTLAQKASIFGIGVLWGFRDRGVLEGSGANAIIKTPAQVIEYLS